MGFVTALLVALIFGCLSGAVFILIVRAEVQHRKIQRQAEEISILEARLAFANRKIKRGDAFIRSHFDTGTIITSKIDASTIHVGTLDMSAIHVGTSDLLKPDPDTDQHRTFSEETT